MPSRNTASMEMEAESLTEGSEGLFIETSEELGPEVSEPGEAVPSDENVEQVETESEGDHVSVSSPGSGAQAGGADEGGAFGDEAGDESAEGGAAEATEGEFESVEGWDPEAVSSTESTTEADEALIDAFFASQTAKGGQEFFGALVPLLVPAFKALLPTLVGGIVRQGGQAIQAQVRNRLQQRLQRLQRLGVPVKAAMPRGKESSEGSALTEAEFEALDESLAHLESVLGVDDRKRQTPTNKVPWNRICHLRIRPRTGSGFFYGTGFLIGKRTVATAGHCVFMNDAGGWAREIEVTPGRDGATFPHPMAKAVSFRSVRGWVSGRKRICDYGAIIMPPGWSMPQPTAFGYGVLSDKAIAGARLNLAGYPGDIRPPKGPRHTLWFHGRKGATATKNVISYQNDSFGGQSGSPVWIKRGSKRICVGVHTNGGLHANSATRITSDVRKNFDQWRAEGGV